MAGFGSNSSSSMSNSSTSCTTNTNTNTNNNNIYVPPTLDMTTDDDQFNSKFADEILSKELLGMTLKDRTEIQEEIHGVNCLAPEETPEFIQESLKKLALELTNDTHIPPHQKQAYLQSQELYQNRRQQNYHEQQQRSQRGQRGQRGQLDTNDTDTTDGYVNSNEFRLRFLRHDLFDISKAALRLVRYLDYIKQFFGLYALMRPIKISDFSKYELAIIRKGYIQLCPYRDRSGRRIILLFPSLALSNIDESITAKILLYYDYVLSCDADTQRKGIVMIVWMDPSFSFENTLSGGKYKKMRERNRVYEAGSCRSSAIHICTPEKPFYKFRRALWVIAVGEARSRLKVHTGAVVELRYILHCYGIPADDDLPISFSGTIKTKYCKQWIRIRERIEKEIVDIRLESELERQRQRQRQRQQRQNQNQLQQQQQQQQQSHNECSIQTHYEEDNGIMNNGKATKASDSGGGVNGVDSISDVMNKLSIVECPLPSDIIFRQGTSVMNHPGNSWLRSLVQSKFEEGFGNFDDNIVNNSNNTNKNSDNMSISDNDSDTDIGKKYSTTTTSTTTTTATTTRTTTTAGNNYSNITTYYKTRRTRPLAEELMKEIKKQNCRVLIWNDKEFGWWSKFNGDEELIFNKIEYICRDFLFSSNKSQRINRCNTINTPKTSMNTSPTKILTMEEQHEKQRSSLVLLESQQKRQREQKQQQQQQSNSNSYNNGSMNIVNQRGGTSIFRSLTQQVDNTNNNKRRRPVVNNINTTTFTATGADAGYGNIDTSDDEHMDMDPCGTGWFL